jgi:L-alanine-DL-glutamate epimerase-like enolase superfamily enzyme
VKLSFYRYELKLKHPFTIARGSRTIEPVVIVQLEHNDIVGYGEAAPSARYGETETSVQAFLPTVNLAQFESPFELESISEYMVGLTEGNYSAKAAIDIALHDWIGKKLGIPLYRYWGLDKTKAPVTSFTIGIDKPEIIEKKIEEAQEFPILKIKLGGDNDEEIMRTIRKATRKTLRVDANEGWKTREVALEKIKWLEQEGVEFVEQPLPASDLAGVAWVRERVNLPLVADESCIRLQDVPRLINAYDGINIKLMKCTGLREAIKMIHSARSCGMKVMVGCMVETSVAITAAAHLSPLVDYADLDGSVLTTNDPFEGVKFERGKLVLPDWPGLGIKARD